MRRFRNWLLTKFLPAWAKNSVYRENAALRHELAGREQEILELNAYIDGLEQGLRSTRRIVIRKGGAS